MRVVHESCCGLDVHKKSVVACLLTGGATGRAHKEVRLFGTMTEDLLALADWLQAAGCASVAMESTGVYWIPLFELLESRGVPYTTWEGWQLLDAYERSLGEAYGPVGAGDAATARERVKVVEREVMIEVSRRLEHGEDLSLADVDEVVDEVAGS